MLTCQENVASDNLTGEPPVFVGIQLRWRRIGTKDRNMLRHVRSDQDEPNQERGA
jgi:hypothetical protein